MEIKMNHLNLKKITCCTDDGKGTLIVIDNFPSNKLNFIEETSMRGNNGILQKYMKVMITENIDVKMVFVTVQHGI